MQIDKIRCRSDGAIDFHAYLAQNWNGISKTYATRPLNFTALFGPALVRFNRA